MTGNQLHQYRTNANFTRAELAGKIGVSTATVQYWESKNVAVKDRYVGAISKVLGVTSNGAPGRVASKMPSFNEEAEARTRAAVGATAQTLIEQRDVLRQRFSLIESIIENVAALPRIDQLYVYDYIHSIVQKGASSGLQQK